jgi:hypothetical protein
MSAINKSRSALVDPIRVFFPKAIHIRQFHGEASLGLVYVHFPFRNKLCTPRTPTSFPPRL